MKKYEAIVPQDIREELTKGARSESDYMWLIADRALSIYQRCMVKQIDVTESDIWTAVAHYCRKPAIRVKQIAMIGGVYSSELRAMITEKYGYWEFGYYEKTLTVEYARNDLFEFLHLYDKGELVTPGRRLGVGEFIFLYEAHIEGKMRGYPPQKSTRIYAGRVAFNTVLNAASKLKARLTMHMGKGPAVARTVELIAELETVAPKAMEEMGFSIIKVDKIESAEV